MYQKIDRFYIRFNNETMRQVMERHYGDFFHSVDEALSSAKRWMKTGDVVEVVDEFGKVYCVTGQLQPEQN